jgi:hypothetical protein
MPRVGEGGPLTMAGLLLCGVIGLALLLAGALVLAAGRS